MKQETVKDFIVISNSNLSQFQNDVKQFLHDHKTATRIDVLSSTTSAGGSNAHIYWEEVVQIPENIKDEFILRGETYTCGQCPFYGVNGSDDPRKAFDCLHSVTMGRKRSINNACLYFYQKLASGEVRPCDTQ